MPDNANEEIEGNTLSVYAFIVHADKPVGTREVTRGANLSSTSVGYRHLQKLETLGLIEKNQYGDYTLKEKARVGGHMWVGRNLVPRLMLFSFFFVGALSAELVIILFSYLVNRLVLETSFFFLCAITAIAAILFLIEGLSLNRRVNSKHGQK